jgi:hypothetical protein
MKKQTVSPNMNKDEYNNYSSVINSYVKTYLFREATPEEVLKYIGYMSDVNDTESLSKRIKKTSEYQRYKRIANEVDTGEFAPITPVPTGHTETSYASSPSLEVILQSSLRDMNVNCKQEIYFGIMELYSKVLRRYPTASELRYYAIRLNTDKAFTLKKMEIILRTSKECNNLANDSGVLAYEKLNEGPSSAQLDFEVEELYKNTTEKLDPPAPPLSEELFSFLKYKYRHFEMDEDRLQTLILKLCDVDLKTRSLNADKVIYKNNPVQAEDHTGEYFETYLKTGKNNGFYPHFEIP